MAYYPNGYGNAGNGQGQYNYYYAYPDGRNQNNKYGGNPYAGAPNPYAGNYNTNGNQCGQGQELDTFDFRNYERKEGEFTFGLLTCCSRGSGFCCDSYCCYYCNLARQCGLGTGESFAVESGALVGFGLCLVDWFVIGFTCMPFCCGGCVSWGITCCTRGKVRSRFGIKGDACSDCCASVCCSWCVIQQMQGEFVAWGYNPPTGCNSYGEESNYPTPQVNAHMA